MRFDGQPRRAGDTLITPDGPSLAGMTTMMIVLLLAAGSLTPFDLKADPWAALTWPGWPVSDAADIMTNVLVYLPVGAALAWLALRRRGRLPAAGLAVLGSALISLVLETCQSMVVGRYASWIDVGFNCCGAAVGAIAIAVSRQQMISWWRRQLVAARKTPWQTLAGLAVIGTMLYGLLPWGFVTDPATLLNRLRLAVLPPWSLAPAGRLIPDGPTVQSTFTALVEGHDWRLAAALACLACLGVLSGWERGRSVGRSVMRGVLISTLVGCLIEGLQLFSVWHAFELAALGANALAALTGALAGAHVLIRAEQRPEAPVLMPTVLLVPFAVLLTVWVTTLDGQIGRLAGGAATWVPLANYARQPAMVALTLAAETVGAYALLTFTAGFLLQRCCPAMPTPLLGRLTVAAALLLATGSGLVTGSGSLSQVVLALIGATLSVRIQNLLGLPASPTRAGETGVEAACVPLPVVERQRRW